MNNGLAVGLKMEVDFLGLFSPWQNPQHLETAMHLGEEAVFLFWKGWIHEVLILHTYPCSFLQILLMKDHIKGKLICSTGQFGKGKNRHNDKMWQHQTCVLPLYIRIEFIGDGSCGVWYHNNLGSSDGYANLVPIIQFHKVCNQRLVLYIYLC